MRALFPALVLLVGVLIVPVATHAWTHGSAGACAKALDNGCAASPGGNFQVANFFTGYTGTVYPSHISKNNCGVDFKCGMPLVTNLAANDPVVGGAVCGMDTMQDPKTATTGGNDDPGCGIMPVDCAYSESVITSQLTVPQIACASTANNIVIRGMNMAAVGGHGSTYFFFAATATGNKTFAFDNFEADPSTYYQNSFGSFTSGSSGDAWFYATNLNGHWLDTYSAQGNGTGSISGTTLTISACSGCAYKVGQYISTASVATNNAAITAQLTGTGGASCPDVTCTNGVGTYSINQSVTRASQTVTSRFSMGGGMGLNTSGNIHFRYNAIRQINGRVCTASQRPVGGLNTTVGTVEQIYNYIEGGLYVAAGVHYEICEWVLQDGQLPMTWSNVINNGNVIFADTNIEASSTSAQVFLAPGAVANLAANYTEAMTNVTMNDNTVVIKGGAQSSAALAATDGRGLTIANLTSTGNEIDRGVASYYVLLNGSPAIGGVNQVSFFAASDDGAHNLTVSAFQGGVPIAIGMQVFETKGHITAQQSGTTGGAGVYTVSDTTVSGGSNKRSAFDAITNVPTVSGNTELTTGASISQSSYLSLSTGANFSLFNGF